MKPVLTLPSGLPDYTLGWDVLEWGDYYIRQPDGPNAGERFVLTDEQVRFVLRWYAVDLRGRWLYTRGVLRRAKGWGKSPLVAFLSLAELCGPVRFQAWAEGGETRPWRARPYEAGEPIAMPTAAAWVQLAGVSEKQTVNTMAMVLAMVAESPIVEDYGLDVGISRIYTAAGGRLEPITASAKTAEGARPTFVVADETHWWTDENGGTNLDRVCRRNVGKIPGGTGRMLETTNAHAVGQQSVAERSYEAWLAMEEGRARRTGLLYDAREAPADIDLTDEDELIAALEAAYGDSTWVDLERLRDEIWDPSTSPQDSRRFYLNQISAATDALLAEPEWAACARPDKIIHDGDSIVLGFDGSRKRTHSVTDATALVGCRIDDGHVFPIEVWEQPEGANEWEVPVGQVLARVDDTFSRYNVVGFFADPARWEGHISAWEARWNRQLKVKATRDHPIEWWMTGGRVTAVVRAIDQMYNAILDGEMTHDGSHTLTRHALNARRHMTPSGMVVKKEHPESARKIDAFVAMVLAWQARLEAIKEGAGGRPTVALPFKVR